MNFTAKPYTQGKITVISGPVESGKTQTIESTLDAWTDSGYKNGSNYLVARHPQDDPNPEMIGKHKVLVTPDVHDIYNKITPHTRHIIIVGASFYKDPSIVELADAIARGNRNLITSGLNLNTQGQPHDFMPDLMAIADEVILQKGICIHPQCHYENSNRSIILNEEYKPACTHHAHYPNSPPISSANQGSLELFVGPMYSGKSTSWRRELEKAKTSGLEPIIFKWTNDARYGEIKRELFEEGDVYLHNGSSIKAISIGNAEHILEYLKKNPDKREVFIDEIQFITNSYNLCLELLSQGYHFHVTGLPRGFNRKPFGEVPKLMCLADKINYNYANCRSCFHPATDNQRMKKIGNHIEPAHIDDPLVAVGGSDNDMVEFYYEARCLADWELKGEPTNPFYLKKYKP